MFYCSRIQNFFFNFIYGTSYLPVAAVNPSVIVIFASQESQNLGGNCRYRLSAKSSLLWGRLYCVISIVPYHTLDASRWKYITLSATMLFDWSIVFSPPSLVTPTWCNSHTVLRFERPAPSQATEVRVPFSLSRYSDLHASDQIYPRPSLISATISNQELATSWLGGASNTSRGFE